MLINHGLCIGDQKVHQKRFSSLESQYIFNRRGINKTWKFLDNRFVVTAIRYLRLMMDGVVYHDIVQRL